MTQKPDAAATGDAGPWIGRPLPRFEDVRLVQGQGRFTDDFSREGLAIAVMARAQRAHAIIRSIDANAARAVPGVLAVLTGAEYRAVGLNALPVAPNPASAFDVDAGAFDENGPRPIARTPQWPLAVDRVRFPGEGVAFIVAETLAAARDGLEALHVEYEDLPCVTGIEEALAPDAPQLWEEAPGNIAFEDVKGDPETAERALAQSHLVIEQEFRNQRISVSFMEPRAALGEYDAAANRYTLTSGSQGPHRLLMSLTAALGEPKDNIRVVSTDTGGGFGSRNDCYPEQALTLWAAKRVGRPVRWTNERTESFLSDYHGRDIVTRIRLGFDAEGRITGLGLDILGNLGAQTLSFVQLHNTWRVAPSVYRVPVAGLRLRGVLTNTVPTGPFRGAGRPEATLAIERCLDLAADRLGIDRIELRRRNLVSKGEFPYTSASGLIYDSGDFAGNMRKALAAADWKGFARRKRAAQKAGKLAGIGISNYVESPVGAPVERVDLTVQPGAVELVVGTHSTGQGHETSFAQVIADMLGIAPDEVRFVSGDTDRIPMGGGSHSDRSMRLAGALMVQASGKVIAQAKKVAAALLDAPVREIAFEDGLFAASDRNRRLSLFDIADAIETNAALTPDLRAPLAAFASMRGRIPAYPTGAAVCEVEIDPETGVVRIVRYTAIDDAGQPINPLILHGQVHGGIVHGVGQALCETVAYDSSNGQVVSASFMDYAMPRADLTPAFDVHIVEDRTKNKANLLRVKGGGEGGTTPAPAAIMNAICDALKEAGVAHLDMPATPDRVWRALRQAGAGAI